MSEDNGMFEDDGMREDVLKPGEVAPDSMELYKELMEMREDIRDQIVVLAMIYIQRLLAEESPDDPTLH